MVAKKKKARPSKKELECKKPDPNTEPVPSPQDQILEDCSMIACVADDIEEYINTYIADENFKAYLLGRLTSLQSNIDFLGHALAQPEKARQEMEEGDSPQAVNDIFEELFTRIANIETGLVTAGIGMFCEDCDKYAPPVECIEDEHQPVCFMPPAKEEKPN